MNNEYEMIIIDDLVNNDKKRRAAIQEFLENNFKKLAESEAGLRADIKNCVTSINCDIFESLKELNYDESIKILQDSERHIYLNTYFQGMSYIDACSYVRKNYSRNNDLNYFAVSEFLEEMYRFYEMPLVSDSVPIPLWLKIYMFLFRKTKSK